ncbi:MAG TPA: MBL fold metallo-hydrolase [Candidatus Acidoferrales bacterium]|nr:MBL fold metallo-hydrolase [Candidatus Acidoferrales bacterium]
MKAFFRLGARTQVALFLLALSASAVPAQDKMRLVKIADDVYMMENQRGSSNSTFIITPDGVVVFDFDIRTADQTLAAIRKFTDKKVRYLISSHSAGDHATGAWHFREDKPVYIASRSQVRDLYNQEGQAFEERKASNDPRNAAYKDKELVRPDIAFDGSLTLYFGGLTFQLVAEGFGHSTGDLAVYIPQKRVMLMGDLLNTEIHPGQGESGGTHFSQVQNWIEILDRISERNLPVDTYVPGHGPVHVGRGVKDLEEQKRYFVVMRDEVAKMIQAGKSLQEIQKDFKLPQEFAHYKRPERLRAFLRLFYNQLIEKGG